MDKRREFSKGNKEKPFGKDTQEKRKKLFDGEKAIQEEALRELERHGPEKSERKWWAFEGFTSVDCLLETDKIVIGIEGKRTETGQSKSVSWYKNRDQLIRNIEALQQKVGCTNKENRIRRNIAGYCRCFIAFYSLISESDIFPANPRKRQSD